MNRELARRHVRCVALLAVSGMLGATAAGAQPSWRTLDEFLTRGIRLSASETAALARGETVARKLSTGDDRDVAVFGAVQIDVPRSFFVERQRDLAQSLRTPTRRQVQLLSNPAVAADLQGLDVTPDDLKELRACRPNDCNFKLPATDMDRLRTTVNWSAPDARSRVAAYARQRMVEYVTDYRKRGNAAMLVYDDRGTTHSSDALASMLRDSSYVFSAVPSLGRHLIDYPQDTLADATEVMFWSRDELPHLRRVLRITHATIYSPPELPQMTLVAAKQIYADHYFEAGLEVLAAIDRAAASAPSAARGITVVSVRRYRFDHLPSGGLLNIRGRVMNGLRDNALADLTRLKRETETAWAETHNR
jgi:hypothetical protein